MLAHSNPEHRLMVIAVSRMHPPENLIPTLAMCHLGSWRFGDTAGWRWSTSALEAMELRDLNALYLNLEAYSYTEAGQHHTRRSAVA